MKRIVLMVVCMVLLSGTSWAKAVNLAWDASPTPGVVGYVLYYDNDGLAPWDYNVDVGNVLTHTIDDLAPGTWFFTCTAYNGSGESIDSNIVNDDIPVFVPPNDAPHPPVTIPAPVTITINGSVTIQ